MSLFFLLGQKGFRPTNTPNLQLWLDASDTSTITDSSGLVDIVADKSGNGLSGTATGADRPVTGSRKIGAKNCISFDGTQYLNLGQPSELDFTPSTDEFTIFVVSAVANGNTGTLIGKGGLTTGQRQWQTFIGSGGIFDTIIGGVGGNDSADISSVPNIQSVVVTDSTQEIFINGTTTTASAIGSATNSADILIGARRGTDVNTGTGFLLTGDIGEIIIYSRALSTTERMQVEAYLTNKWIYANTLIVAGASITNFSYPGLQDLINETYNTRFTTVDAATGGWDTTDLRDNIDSILTASAVSGGYVFVHIGGNNVTDTRPFSTATDLEKTTITDDITYILNAISSAGMTPLLSSLTFRDYNDTTVYQEENGSKPYNDSLINPLYASLYPEWCFDDGQPYLQMYDVFRNNYNTILSADNVHPSTEGEGVFRQHIVDTVIDRILNNSTPTQLYSPSGVNMEFWHDYADTSTITDTAGVVSAVTDKSSKGITTSTTAGPTTNSVTINGLNALSFDGASSQHLNIGQPASLDFTPQTDEFTIFIVSEVATGNEGTLIGKAGSTSSLRQYQAFIGSNTAQSNVGGVTDNSATTFTNRVSITTLEVTTTTQELFRDGAVTNGTSAIGTATNGADILIGARRADNSNTGITFAITGKIGEIIIYSGVLSEEEFDRTSNYLNRKWRNA